MENKEERPRICRRLKSDAPNDYCTNTIDRANPLNWCAECRAERLPIWPQ